MTAGDVPRLMECECGTTWRTLQLQCPNCQHDAEPLPPTHPARSAEADQRVLDTSQAVDVGALRWLLSGGVSTDLMEWARAELARRGLPVDE